MYAMIRKQKVMYNARKAQKVAPESRCDDTRQVRGTWGAEGRAHQGPGRRTDGVSGLLHAQLEAPARAVVRPSRRRIDEGVAEDINDDTRDVVCGQSKGLPCCVRTEAGGKEKGRGGRALGQLKNAWREKPRRAQTGICVRAQPGGIPVRG